MADHTLTLTEAQEEALLAWRDQQRVTLALPGLTAASALLTLVTVPLLRIEMEQEAAKLGLRDAALKLAPSFLEALMEGLTQEQLERFAFLLPLDEEGG